jgi:hypothetical protein
MKPAATWEPWSAAKAKANFWKWFTIDLIVVSLVTYAFDLSTFWVSFFVAVPLVLRKQIIAIMMNRKLAETSDSRCGEEH